MVEKYLRNKKVLLTEARQMLETTEDKIDKMIDVLAEGLTNDIKNASNEDIANFISHDGPTQEEKRFVVVTWFEENTSTSK